MKRFYDIYRPQRSPDDIRPMSHYFRSPDISFSPFTKIGHLADAGEAPDTASAAPAPESVPVQEPDYSVFLEHKKAVFPAGFKLPETTAIDPPIPPSAPRKIPVLTPLETSKPATAATSTASAAPKRIGLISELRYAAGKHLRKKPHAYSARENSAPILPLTSQRMKGIGLLLTSALLVAVLGYNGASDEQSASRTPSRVSPKPAITANNTSASAESNVAPVDTSALTNTPPEATGDTNTSPEAPTSPAPSSSRRTTYRANFGSSPATESPSQSQSPVSTEIPSPAPTDNNSSAPSVIPEIPTPGPTDVQPETPVVTDPPAVPTDPTTQPELPPTPSAVPIPTPTLPIGAGPGTP